MPSCAALLQGVQLHQHEGRAGRWLLSPESISLKLGQVPLNSCRPVDLCQWSGGAEECHLSADLTDPLTRSFHRTTPYLESCTASSVPCRSIVDRQPRTLDEEGCRLLVNLAGMAMRELENASLVR